MTLETKIESFIKPIIEENKLFLEQIKISQAGKNTLVKIIIDLIDEPGGVSSDQIVEISRQISKAFDKQDPIKNIYTLEVTTAGAEREITNLRLWKRAVNRTVKFTYEQNQTTQNLQGKVEKIIDNEKVQIDGKEYEITKITKAKTIIVF